MYPEKFLNSLKAVEASREKNISSEINRMSASEKEELLSAFHPDYNKNAFETLKTGANKGDLVPKELCGLLQAESLINPDDIDLSKPDYDTDVLIIGGGGAGACAALEADKLGAKVLLATKLRLGDSNTIMAQGGIQAAINPNDSPAVHFTDSYGGGHFAADKELLSRLVLNGPEAIEWLGNLGVEFDTLSDGTIVTALGGGTSRKRMISAKDFTGTEIMRTLKDEVESRFIPVLDFSSAVELIKDENGKAAGAVLSDTNTGKLSVVRAKTVVLATGGSGRIHYQAFPTSNHYGATGDGLILGYRAGAELVFADSMQYHPTGAAYPPQLFGALVTEKLRSLGAKLVNADGEQFVHPLEARDVVTAAIIRECTEREKGVSKECAVWLDTPMIDKIHGDGFTKQKAPAMLRMFLDYGIDIRTSPVLIYPTLHYQNGGLKINPDAKVFGIENLYAAGELVGGIHGKNRLMGNSLLDVIVFGRIAGKNAAEKSKSENPEKLTLAHVKDFEKKRIAAGITEDMKSPLVLPDYTRKISEI